MPKHQTPQVLSKPWFDWYFDASKEPFDKATNDAEVKAKQKKIEKYASSELSKKRPSWSLEFKWSIADTIPLVYNLKARIIKQNLKIAAAVALTRGVGTPQPPPQPPPPNL